jgi:hypothetical protein
MKPADIACFGRDVTGAVHAANTKTDIEKSCPAFPHDTKLATPTPSINATKNTVKPSFFIFPPQQFIFPLVKDYCW